MDFSQDAKDVPFIEFDLLPARRAGFDFKIDAPVFYAWNAESMPAVVAPRLLLVLFELTVELVELFAADAAG